MALRLRLGFPDPTAILLRHFLQEAGGHGGSGTTKQHTLPRVGQGQLLHSAGHSHIAQAPLLLHLLRLTHSAVAGEQAIFHTHHIHVGELQALGAVHGHHHHAVIAVLRAVEVGIECHFIEESRQ